MGLGGVECEVGRRGDSPACSREEAVCHLVDRHVEYRWVRLEYLLSPVAVVHVPIDDKDTLKLGGTRQCG